MSKQKQHEPEVTDHKNSSHADFPPVVKVTRALLRSKLRGTHRLATLLINNVASLKATPIPFADRSPVYMDVSVSGRDSWLRESPCQSSSLEAGEQSVMRRFVKDGDTVFDIGANIGLHTTLLARLVGCGGHIYAFEPNPEVRLLLEQTIALINNATLLPFALSDESGRADLFVPNDLKVDSVASLRNEWTRGVFGATHTVACEVRRLDELIEAGTLPHPNFIKCDVEGAELKVFHGAEETLNRADAPMVMFEVAEASANAFGATRDAASDFLLALPKSRYELFMIHEDGNLTREQTTKRDYWNLLAIPASRAATYSEPANRVAS